MTDSDMTGTGPGTGVQEPPGGEARETGRDMAVRRIQAALAIAFEGIIHGYW